MSNILLVNLEEALLQFPPAIWGGTNLNENQAERLAEKLVKLLVQRCELDVIEFEAEVETEMTAESLPEGDFASSRKMVAIPDEFADCDKLKFFVVKKPEEKDEKEKT